MINRKIIKIIKHQLHRVGLFIKLFLHRYHENKLNLSAGYLTYSTMLALVPLTMVMFAIFAAFPAFNEVTGDLQHLIFNNFTPEVGEVLQDYINKFVSNSRRMSAVGIIGLIVVALMLISSIDKTLNNIWINTNVRTPFVSFTIYWMILTLGPLFIGAGLIVSSYLTSIQIFSDGMQLPFAVRLLSFVPFILTWGAFTLVYTIVPNTHVNIRYAMIGALVAAIFFTLGKQAFTWYITNFPSYQIIYGALATLPILLVWIQLSWTFVLLGAQLTSVLEDFKEIKKGNFPLSQRQRTKQAKLEEELQVLQSRLVENRDDRINPKS